MSIKTSHVVANVAKRLMTAAGRLEENLAAKRQVQLDTPQP